MCSVGLTLVVLLCKDSLDIENEKMNEGDCFGDVALRILGNFSILGRAPSQSILTQTELHLMQFDIYNAFCRMSLRVPVSGCIIPAMSLVHHNDSRSQTHATGGNNFQPCASFQCLAPC